MKFTKLSLRFPLIIWLTFLLFLINACNNNSPNDEEQPTNKPTKKPTQKPTQEPKNNSTPKPTFGLNNPTITKKSAIKFLKKSPTNGIFNTFWKNNNNEDLCFSFEVKGALKA